MDVLGSTQLKAVRDLPLLSEEEFQALIKKRDEGDNEAIHTIAIHNLRLGYSQVAKTISQMSYQKIGDVDADDIWQEVYLSLVEAAKGYDPNLKGQFSTYAYHFISNKCFTILHQWRKHLRSHPGPALDKEEIVLREPVKDKMADEVEEKTDTDRLYDELNRALRTLDEEEYMVLALIYGIGGSPLRQKDAAESLGISISSLKGSIQKSFRKVRQLVLTRTKDGDPEYPLLLQYWSEFNKETLALALTPLLIEDNSQDELEELWDDLWED